MQRDYLGHALEVTRAVIKTSGFRLAAQNGPPSIVDSGQINSTDSVSVGAGFALLTGTAWTQLFELLPRGVRVAGRRRSCGMTSERLTHAQRVYGLASYLLVQTALSVYGVHGPLNPLYRDQPRRQDDGNTDPSGRRPGRANTRRVRSR